MVSKAAAPRWVAPGRKAAPPPPPAPAPRFRVAALACAAALALAALVLFLARRGDDELAPPPPAPRPAEAVENGGVYESENVRIIFRKPEAVEVEEPATEEETP